MRKIIIAAVTAAIVSGSIVLLAAANGTPESNAKRGCEASAYQASRYGHNLEQNLKVCASL